MSKFTYKQTIKQISKQQLLLFIIGLCLSGSTVAQAAPFCSNVLGPASQTQESSIKISAEEERKISAQSEQLLAEINAYLKYADVRRVDVEIADLLMKKTAPLLNKSSEIIRKKIEAQQLGSENGVSKDLLSTSKKIEMNMLSLAKYFSQSKSLSVKLMRIFPFVADLRTKSLNLQANHLANDAKNFRERIDIQTKDLVDTEEHLRAEERNLSQSLQTLTEVQAELQAQYWELEKLSPSAEVTQTYKDAQLNLSQEISGISSVLAVTKSLREHVNSSISENKMALTYYNRVMGEQTALLNAISQRAIEIKPQEREKKTISFLERQKINKFRKSFEQFIREKANGLPEETAVMRLGTTSVDSILAFFRMYRKSKAHKTNNLSHIKLMLNHLFDHLPESEQKKATDRVKEDFINENHNKLDLLMILDLIKPISEGSFRRIIQSYNGYMDRGSPHFYYKRVLQDYDRLIDYAISERFSDYTIADIEGYKAVAGMRLRLSFAEAEKLIASLKHRLPQQLFLRWFINNYGDSLSAERKLYYNKLMLIVEFGSPQ